MASLMRGIAPLVALTGSLLAPPVTAAPLLDPQIRAAHFEARLGEPVVALIRLQARICCWATCCCSRDWICRQRRPYCV